MVDVGKSTRVNEAEVRSNLDRMEMIEALRHGNIYEVFAKSKTFKISDFHDFFAEQWRSWRGQLVQDAEIKSGDASYPEPNINQFHIHHRGAAINKDEGDYFSKSMNDFMGMGGKFKAVTVKGIGDSGKLKGSGEGQKEPMTPEELAGATEGTLEDWDKFLENTWSQILDNQMLADYKDKMSEIQSEVQRIIWLAKQGVVGPEFVLIALAKVNACKNGVIMTWAGKKAYHLNDSLNKIANDLRTMNPSDPGYAGALQAAQSRTRDGSFQMQMVQSDLQKAVANVEQTLERVTTSINDINRTRREIITKLSAS